MQDLAAAAPACGANLEGQVTPGALPPRTEESGQTRCGRAGPGRVPALDGVRGIAILLVMVQNLYVHVPSSRLTDLLVARVADSGWVGVDLFFVLSGFLITGVLWEAKGTPGYFRNFYARRVLRIFPLYYGLLIVLFVVVPLLRVVDARVLAPLLDVQGWYWSYLTNVLIAREGWDAAPLKTAHFWSLAVEEQFYLLWPLVVVLCGRGRLIMVCASAIIVALGLRVAGWAWDVPSAALYTLTPARMDALAVGALLAMLVRDPLTRQRLERLAGRASLLLASVVFGLWLWRDGLDAGDPVIQTVGYTVTAMAGGAAVLLGSRSGGAAWASRLLGAPLLRVLGRYSYGIYLFHPLVKLGLQWTAAPLFALPAVLGFQWIASSVPMLIAGMLAVALAAVSWHAYESPFLRLKARFGPGPSEPVA
jgi:peptidoglycan/LPS O-acetylase OafA/YrhL